MEVLSRVLLDVFVELALGKVSYMAAVLHGYLVDEVGPMGDFRGLILLKVLVDCRDGRVRTECLLHVFTRLWCLNVIVLHDLLIDFKSDLLKVLVL